jgi:16S rRNA A1518/A1519 N6-dimethyltransferase RsmA/KsgA/DIM1 with predicted DNA glycosylase/AP lyase activity
MPSSPSARKEMFQFLPEIESGEVFELGSGFGALAIPLARHYPNLQITGFEISLVPYWISVLRARYLGLGNLRFVRQDFFSADLTRARLLVSYLYPEGMNKISSKLQTHQASGQYFLSHTFALPGYKPIRSGRAGDLYQSPVYLYELGNGPNPSSSGEA